MVPLTFAPNRKRRPATSTPRVSSPSRQAARPSRDVRSTQRRWTCGLEGACLGPRSRSRLTLHSGSPSRPHGHAKVRRLGSAEDWIIAVEARRARW